MSGELLILLPHGAHENVAGLSARRRLRRRARRRHLPGGRAHHPARELRPVAPGSDGRHRRRPLCPPQPPGRRHRRPLCPSHRLHRLLLLRPAPSPSIWWPRRRPPAPSSSPPASSAPRAGWAVLLGTTSTVGLTVHVLQQALKLAATTDPLTGLVNRRAFEPILGRELHRCARLGHPLCLVVIDLDHFKLVNDAHGHQEGDRLLAEVAARLDARPCGPPTSSPAPGATSSSCCCPRPTRPMPSRCSTASRAATDQEFSAGVAVATGGMHRRGPAAPGRRRLLPRQAERAGATSWWPTPPPTIPTPAARRGDDHGPRPVSDNAGVHGRGTHGSVVGGTVVDGTVV